MTSSPDLIELRARYGALGTLRASFRLIIVLAWIFINIPVQIVFRALKMRARFFFPHFFHKIITQNLLGMKIEVKGAPSRKLPTLFLSNHLSYADIPVYSSVIATSFVARADVAGWPLLGLLAKLQDTVFVERTARSRAPEQNQEIFAFLKSGHNLVLFPEGTSTDGMKVLPFKSALLQGVFESGQDIIIQPVSLACMNKDGSQHLYPWHGDMNFPEHVWPFLKVPRFHMRLTFHPPLALKKFTDRKALADAAHAEVLRAAFGVVT